MFAKRVKTVRDMSSEIDILERKINREISKLNDNIHFEIKKKLKKIVPGIQIRIKKIQINDFLKNEKQGTPLLVLVQSLNGQKVHLKGVWVDGRPVNENPQQWFQTDNRVTVEMFEDVCRELSEKLGVNLQIERVSGKVG